MPQSTLFDYPRIECPSSACRRAVSESRSTSVKKTQTTCATFCVENGCSEKET